MEKIIVLLVALAIITTGIKANNGNSKMTELAPKEITYVDGNNNSYVVKNIKNVFVIEYIPISKEMSSSGEYDGGQPYKITISEAEHKNLTELLTKADKDYSQLTEDRTKGCGTVILPKGKRFFLKMDSFTKTTIERKFQELKSKYLVIENKPQGDTLIVEGVMVERNFVSKKGVVKDIKEYYFVPTETDSKKLNLVKEYFVKISKGNVQPETLKAAVGKPARYQLIVFKGLLDTDDSNQQSRYGDYVVLLQVVN